MFADVIPMGSGGIRARHLNTLRRRGLRPSTIEQRRRCLDRLARHVGHDELLEVTEPEIESFIDRLAGTDGAAAEIYHLRGFYSWAVEYELTDTDPTARLRRPKIPRRLPRPIPTDELARALTAPPDRVKPMLYLAAYAGLRAQDMCGLRAEDLRWQDRLIIVTDGKGGDEGIVDMSETLMHGLRSSALPKSGWLFRYADGRPGHLAASRVSQLANHYLHRIGIAATLHQLRHWAGTEFYRATRDVRATQAFLRHRSITSTTIYTEVDRTITLDGVERLPALHERTSVA